MIKVLKQCLVVLILVPFAACAADNSPYKEGDHYVKLPKPVTTAAKNKIEVVELFWYGCPHCFALEPLVKKWESDLPADVEFKRMPAIMARHWENHGRAYYVAEVLGVLDKTHEALFHEIHRNRKRVADQMSLAAFYAGLGVDEVKFNATFKSFAVNSKIQQARAKQLGYRATGVPAIIVNGKYRVGSTMKAGAEGMFDVVDYLIEQERKAAEK